MPAHKIEAHRSRLTEFIATHNIDTVTVVSTDLHGYTRGKQMAAKRFLASLDAPIHLSTLFTMLDCGNYPIEPPGNDKRWWPSWEDGYSDSFAELDPTTIRLVPWQAKTALIICEFCASNPQNSLAFLPRNLVRELEKRYTKLGYNVRVGLEMEAMLFKRGTDFPVNPNYRNMPPLWAGLEAYIMTNLSKERQSIAMLVNALREFGISVESWHPEAAPGQLEISLAASTPLGISDDCFLLKHAIKELAADNNLVASFMAQISDDGFSNGNHVNFSLWREDQNLFFSPQGRNAAAPELSQTIAGILATLPEFTLLFAPTPNSYRRFEPYNWTGMNVAWGWDNKSTALRAVNESHGGARLELRTAGADVNPYIAVAGILAAGLYGLENQLQPPMPKSGNAYADNSVASVPRDMKTALKLFRASDVAKYYLGEDFVRFYAHTREAEWSLFTAQKGVAATGQVSDWELNRYFELI